MSEKKLSAEETLKRLIEEEEDEAAIREVKAMSPEQVARELHARGLRVDGERPRVRRSTFVTAWLVAAVLLVVLLIGGIGVIATRDDDRDQPVASPPDAGQVDARDE